MKLHILRRNQDFVVDIFCLINGSNLGWCFAFCLLTHLIWNCVYVTLTQSFYARQKYGQVELPDWCHADPRSQHWLRFVHEEEKPSDRPVFQGSLYQGKQEKVIRCPFVGCKHEINHCSKSLLNILVSSYHQTIITSYLVLLHISKTLIHHCCIATSAKMTVGKRFLAK